MKTTKVIECPVCIDQTDDCPRCNGSGLIEVDLTQDELNLQEAELTDPIGYAERVFKRLIF